MTAAELVAGGVAMGRVDGLPIFVANLYPGDVAVVRITEAKRGFARGVPLRIVQPSAFRRIEPCPVAGECGGCDWTALRLDAQLAAKQRILSESLRRIGKIREHPPITIHPSPLNYRLRSRLHRDGETIGFFAAGSHRVVPLAAECEVVGIETAQHPVDGESWELGGAIVTGDRDLTIRVGEFTYRLSSRSFFQVNRHLLSTMLRLLRGHAERVRHKRKAIDLFAGVGFFSLPLSKLFQEVIAVEGSHIRDLRANAPRNVEVVQAPVERFRLPKAEFIFLDPPRAGASRAVIESIARRAAEIICYLSCDPVTFSRDASRLIASGWRLSTLDLLDLFPNTHHVETLASFERAKRLH